jgi:hypothetical protein
MPVQCTLYRISFAALQKYHIDFGLINHSDILVILSSFSKLKENNINDAATVPPF